MGLSLRSSPARRLMDGSTGARAAAAASDRHVLRRERAVRSRRVVRRPNAEAGRGGRVRPAREMSERCVKVAMAARAGGMAAGVRWVT